MSKNQNLCFIKTYLVDIWEFCSRVAIHTEQRVVPLCAVYKGKRLSFLYPYIKHSFKFWISYFLSRCASQLRYT